MKIAHLSLTALPATVGGLEVVVDSLIREQRHAGHDVTLVTAFRQWRAARRAGVAHVLPLPPRRSPGAVPFQSVGKRWPIASAVWMHQMLHRFDLWHIHWLYPTGWLAHDALTRSGVPVVMTAHGADLQTDESTQYGYRRYPLHDARVRDLVPRAQALTAISDSLVETYRELGAAPERIFRIGNGVDVRHLERAGQYRQAVRDQYAIGENTALILSVGRNEPRKGMHFITEALRLLRQQGRDVVWIVVGQDVGQLAPAMEQAGVSDAVRLLPKFTPDGTGHFPPEGLARLFAAADIFAFPSMSEGAPLVAIEAMAAGAVVVGNNVPGIRDTVEHGADGLLCEAANPAAMAQAIVQVLDNAKLKQRLQEGGVAKARQRDWSEISSHYTDLYRTLVDQEKA